jgi:hypothetical protein
MNIFTAPVNININTRGFNAFIIILNGMPDININNILNKNTPPKVYRLELEKIAVIYIMDIIIFMRGSSLCIIELPGKYCPRVISFNIISHSPISAI